MARQLRPGDTIVCQGIRATIKEIAFQEPWEWRQAYYLEFRDTNGIYRSWKQNFDGGYAILSPDEEEEEAPNFSDEIDGDLEDLIEGLDPEDLLKALLEEDVDIWGDEDFDEFEDDEDEF